MGVFFKNELITNFVLLLQIWLKIFFFWGGGELSEFGKYL